MTSINEALNEIENCLLEIRGVLGTSSYDFLSETVLFLQRNREEYKKGYNMLPKYLRKEIDITYSQVTHVRGYKDTLPLNIEPSEWLKLLQKTKAAIDSYKSNISADQ